MSIPDDEPGTEFGYALADSLAFLNPAHWDQVTGRYGLFLSRPFLELLEENLPENLSTHYALAYRGRKPVAAVVAQGLKIRVADLTSGGAPEEWRGFWHSLGEAAQRSITRTKGQVLLINNLLPWARRDERGQTEEVTEMLAGVASDIWRRWRGLARLAERAAELPVGWVSQRFMVCGNLLTTGPHGAAFAEGEDPARLWLAVVESLNRIRGSNPLFSKSDLMMIKDLTAGGAEAESALRGCSFRRFETEPNMIFHVKPTWTCFEDCLKDMKSDYRSRIRKTLKEVEAAGIVLERLSHEEVEAHSAEIHGLYHQVHDRQKLRLVAIQPGWIPALARRFKDDFRTVVARRRDSDKILGFVTVIRDGEEALGYYIGFDKTVASEGAPVYLGLVYAGVGQAIEMGVRRVILGRTALEPKAQIGAKAQPMWGFLRHLSPALNLAVPPVLALLPEPAQPPERHPFKASPGDQGEGG